MTAASAQPVSEPCSDEQIAAADFVATVEGMATVIDTPSPPSFWLSSVFGDPVGLRANSTDTYVVLVDVSPDASSASLAVEIDWEHEGDIDMQVYLNGEKFGESMAFNPTEGMARVCSSERWRTATPSRSR